jgi:hypothetical protein
MDKPVFLFRNSYETEEEFKILKDLYPDRVYEHRTAIPKGSLVVGRFSVLPFYHELEKELTLNNSQLINSHQQHQYVADMKNWYEDLADVTPHTWFTMQEYLASNYGGPVVLKGQTNSKRELWKTHMFANNKDEAREVWSNLLNDSLIGQQNIYIRKFKSFPKYCNNISGMPIIREFRLFVFNQKIIAHGFYWSNFLEESGNPRLSDDDLTVLQIYTDLVGDKSNFYSMDVAEDKAGCWYVIELNEGQMSGVNSIDPKDLYQGIMKLYV